MKLFGYLNLHKGTRVQRIDEMRDGADTIWRVWTGIDASGKYGTYFLLYPTGVIKRVTEREDTGTEELTILPDTGE